MRMLERQSAYDRLRRRERTGMKSEMMSPEPRNEPQMLRWFRKTYPSYDLQPLLLKRQRELEEARAFNNWLGSPGGAATPASAGASNAQRTKLPRSNP